MEGGSQFGTYIAYGFICFFLLFVALMALRSYGMIWSLVVLAFMPPRRAEEAPALEVTDTITPVSPPAE